MMQPLSKQIACHPSLLVASILNVDVLADISKAPWIGTLSDYEGFYII